MAGGGRGLRPGRRRSRDQRTAASVSLPDHREASTSTSTSVRHKVVPDHVAVIMDGNYRWAVERGRSGEEGHAAGIEALRTLVECSVSHDISALTVYAFSVDNWKRSERERTFIFDLFETCLTTELAGLLEKGIRIRFIGNRSELPGGLRLLMERAEAMTLDNSRLNLTIAINYSARDDIVRAARRMAQDAIQPTDITESTLSRYLSTSVIPEHCRHPDLLLRTSGEARLSNFLLWEMAYTELWFTETKWPDFGEKDFNKALLEYSLRERRFGGRGQDTEGEGRAPPREAPSR